MCLPVLMQSFDLRKPPGDVHMLQADPGPEYCDTWTSGRVLGLRWALRLRFPPFHF